MNDSAARKMIVRSRLAVGRGIRRLVLAAIVVLLSGESLPASETKSDWPCIQRLVPLVSAGMVWAGPALDDVPDWRSDPDIATLAGELSNRALPLEEAEARIEGFADAQGADKDRRLTMLFAGILDTINGERSSVIDGIKRYARRQQALAARIESTLAELDALPRDGGSPEQEARRLELSERNLWDSRIYEERERSLAYLCETPVLLEQRVFVLGRTVQNVLD